jgi:hypothetical protein
MMPSPAFGGIAGAAIFCWGACLQFVWGSRWETILNIVGTSYIHIEYTWVVTSSLHNILNMVGTSYIHIEYSRNFKLA